MSEWRKKAVAAISEAHAAIPEDATLEDRTKAVDAAYPFGPRQYHPYKIWLQVRREYLAKFGYRKRAKMPESPLERAMRRSAEAS